MKLKTLKTKTNLDLPADLTALHVGQFIELCQEALSAGKPFTLNGEHVKSIDTLGCQALASCKSSFGEKEIDCQIKTPSEKLSQALTSLGLNVSVLNES